MGLEVPVGGEHDVERGDHGAGQPDRELPPLPPGLLELGLVVARLDEVLGAGHRDPSVDHEDLAVVAEVGPAPVPLQRLEGKHRVPLEAGVVEAAEHVLVAGDPAAGQVVEQDPHLDAAAHRRGERLEERRGHVVPGHDVELDAHEPLGLTDRGGHRGDRLLVDRQQRRVVALGGRQRAEVLVEVRRRAQPGGLHLPGRVRPVGPEGLDALRDERVDLLVDPAASPVDRRAADQQEREDADERQEQHEQQPRRRRGGAAVLGEQPQRKDLDREVEQRQNSRHHACVCHTVTLTPKRRRGGRPIG